MIGAYTVGLKSCSHSPLLFALLFKPRSVGFSVHFQVPYVRFFLIQGRQPRTCMASHLAGKGTLLCVDICTEHGVQIHSFLQVDLPAGAVPLDRHPQHSVAPFMLLVGCDPLRKYAQIFCSFNHSRFSGDLYRILFQSLSNLVLKSRPRFRPQVRAVLRYSL